MATHLAIALAGLRAGLGRILLIEPNAACAKSLPFLPGTQAPRASEFMVTEGGGTTIKAQNMYELHQDDDERPPSTPSAINALALRARTSDADIAVFDLDPLLEGYSAECFAPLMDCVVLVVESERTRMRSLKRAYRSLQDTGVDFLGAVLNKRRYYVPRWIYSRL